MSMVAEEDQSFEGCLPIWQNFEGANQQFYGWSQKDQETKDTFTDDLQVLVRKIIVHYPSFLDANNQLKAQYEHKLQDPYYVAMACSALQPSPEKETFTGFGDA